MLSYLAVMQEKLQQVRLVSRKPILPSQREIDENPRARSAKLRLAEKLDQPQGNQPDEVE